MPTDRIMHLTVGIIEPVIEVKDLGVTFNTRSLAQLLSVPLANKDIIIIIIIIIIVIIIIIIIIIIIVIIIIIITLTLHTHAYLVLCLYIKLEKSGKSSLRRTQKESSIPLYQSSNLEYCNSLLYGLASNEIKKLQIELLNLSRELKNLSILHLFLLVFTGFLYKNVLSSSLSLIANKTLHGLAPDYLSKLLTIYKPAHSFCSSSFYNLPIPRSRTTVCTPHKIISLQLSHVSLALPVYLPFRLFCFPSIFSLILFILYSMPSFVCPLLFLHHPQHCFISPPCFPLHSPMSHGCTTNFFCNL